MGVVAGEPATFGVEFVDTLGYAAPREPLEVAEDARACPCVHVHVHVHVHVCVHVPWSMYMYMNTHSLASAASPRSHPMHDSAVYGLKQHTCVILYSLQTRNCN